MDKKHLIEVSELFEVSASRLWNAITDVEEMRIWFFDNIENFEPRVGFETQFEVAVEDRVFPHVWRIVAVVAEESIVYDWSYAGYEGRALVAFKLSKEEDGVRLTLVNDIIEPFTADIPEFEIESCITGWNYLIRNRLKSYIDNQS